jgi:hypothetical protein
VGRPRLGEKYLAVITENGEIQLEGGDAYSTPSAAAIAAGNVAAYDGWHAWKVGDSRGPSLHELRVKLRLDRDLKGRFAEELKPHLGQGGTEGGE